MKHTQPKPTSKYKHFCSAAFILLFLCSGISAQTIEQWIDIELIDTTNYAQYGTEHVPDSGYPVTQLFDADFSTCWVSRININEAYPLLYIVAPQDIADNFVLNIFSGYGKSQALFLKNARPEKIRVSLNTAVLPDGYVSELMIHPLILKSSDKHTIVLTDTFGLQSINLQNVLDEFWPKHLHNLSLFEALDSFSSYAPLVILELEILSVFPGTTYEDICISEFFFSNCFVSSKKCAPCNHIKNVYLNEEGNTLLADIEKQNTSIVFTDKESILEIIGLTPDKRWAILISIPRESEGRVETLYRIIDVLGQEDISQKVADLFPNHNAGGFVHFEEEDGKNYIIIQNISSTDTRVELR